MYKNYNPLVILLVVFYLSIFINGCASSGIFKVHEPNINHCPSFKLVGQRPDSEIFTRLPSYGKPFIFLSDDTFTPDRLKLLRLNLESKLGEKLSGKEIVITKFEVINYFGDHAQKNK